MIALFGTIAIIGFLLAITALIEMALVCRRLREIERQDAIRTGSVRAIARDIDQFMRENFK